MLTEKLMRHQAQCSSASVTIKNLEIKSDIIEGTSQMNLRIALMLCQLNHRSINLTLRKDNQEEHLKVCLEVSLEAVQRQMRLEQ